ncbi:DUF445 family protein [Oscillatoria sp. CS-180]|uniref:DUF445 domain-containing protein n=1 Tax=Oscillatoria sp. CS-180 TaxID=3021720 RepID=UPI00232DD9F3|nr:DUF445 family protein [Oscillatoria sp. CS-180]MDB9526070.1 DUF445 family protein [Oscillatoria sp. CS-180]
MAWSDAWLLLAPPLVGGVIGYFTNDLAIKMLFRPYRPYYLFKRRLPLTPGLIPSNQARLAQRVADTIMGSLLTPAELENLARRLLQTERTQQAIKWLLELALDQIQSRNQARTAEIVGKVLQDLFGTSLPRLLRVWARRDDFLQAQLDQIFDQVLLEFQFSPEQAQQLSSWLLISVIPPDRIRRLLIDFLTDRNIQIIDEIFRSKTSGTYWVVANLFGVRNALTRLRAFCLDERETSNVRIAELIEALNLNARLQEAFQQLTLQSLPVSAVRELRQTIRETVRNYIKTLGPELLKGLSSTINWQTLATQLLNRLRNSSVITDSLDPVSEELALILERYLEKDLESLVAQVIPILNIDQVIIERVSATNPQELELAVQGIVRNELQAIVNLGGALGFLIGGLQAAFYYFR